MSSQNKSWRHTDWRKSVRSLVSYRDANESNMRIEIYILLTHLYICICPSWEQDSNVNGKADLFHFLAVAPLLAVFQSNLKATAWPPEPITQPADIARRVKVLWSIFSNGLLQDQTTKQSTIKDYLYVFQISAFQFFA